MSDTNKRVLERSQTGEYEFTSYGEFLSYYHAHLQIFNRFIQEKKIPQKDRDQLYQRVKGFMVANIKKADHFFEKIGDFATLLQMDVEELKSHLNEVFIEVLTKVQDKLKEQELDKFNSKKDFAHITEELVFKLGEIFPPNCRFVLRDDLLVIENISTGEIVKPIGILGAIKDEQAKAKEKLAARVVSKPKEPEFVPEISILLEIFEKNEDTLTGELLELKDTVLIDTSPEPEPEPAKESGLLDDVEELDFESDEMPVYDPEITSPEEPGLLDDIEEYDNQQKQATTVDIEPPVDDIEDFLDLVGAPTDPQVDAVQEPEYDSNPVTDPEIGIVFDPSATVPEIDLGPDLEPEPEEEISIESGMAENLDVEPETEIEPDIETEPESESTSEFAFECEPEAEILASTDPADLFTFKEYSELTKKIQTYKSTNDTNGYNGWIAGASDLEKSFVSIRSNFSKEQSGQPVDWNKYFDTIASKTQLTRPTLEKFRRRIKHLDFTKAVLDIVIKELKNQSPEVINILKSAWPHILATFSDAPNYDLVEEKLKTLLSRLKSDSQRLPIQNILIKGIQKLRQKL